MGGREEGGLRRQGQVGWVEGRRIQTQPALLTLVKVVRWQLHRSIADAVLFVAFPVASQPQEAQLHTINQATAGHRSAALR